MFHESPDVKVERNVFLSPPNGDPKRRREIDVLLTSYVAGYPVRIAIECKNESEPIDIDYIDAFVGKLDDVGIPHQHGIFISASNYASGAIDRAKVKGIRTLILTGLTEDRLSEAISEAYQYTVFLLPLVKCIRFTSGDARDGGMIGFQNDSGKLCGFLPDLIWFKWQEGQIPATLGEQEIQLPLPSGWRPIIYDRPVQLLGLPSATIHVVGIVLKLAGEARQHSLIDAANKETEKFRLNVDFNLQRLQDRHINFKTFFTEEKLKAWMERHGNIRLINRIKLPRLQLLSQFYYPMSERVACIVLDQLQAYETGQSSIRPIFRFNELEGSEIKNVWEPIWKGHYAFWSQAQGKVE